MAGYMGQRDLGEPLRSPPIRRGYLCLGGSGGLGFPNWNRCSNCLRFADVFFSDLSLGGSSDTLWEWG